MVILVIYIVISRYVFGVGRADLQELALYLHALVFLGCAGWALVEEEHVRVDILYKDKSESYKKLINTLGLVFFVLPIVFIISFYSIDFIKLSWQLKESSTEPGGLKTVYLHKTIILLFPMVLFLAAVKQLKELWK
jgi:TRAP-type mannitol/chloroaromatic compound transport system permease small subunit